ncbi:type I restriction enzyme endonuclease domain-containing protein [Candidatus Aquiluna sp. UB-MaderosW2red]|uniref:type I restriction enzyme endonuclease domain-containing protein n=1 Tax=Candidatus Aquiluna sp. UB-MaderosW2red TaxID=1855377 RepID=UPI0012F783F9|nr:type I restriction enzyme endonuclease domain-containing protein [Candidatus Aquiluna sp. UB-MaderosW2red]
MVALREPDLYSSLWKGAYELRGGMDTSQYRHFVLTLPFAKYVADKSKSDKSKSDKNSLIDVPSGGSFDNLVTFKGDKEIGDKTNKAISKLAEGDGLLGEAYEYLMRHFATESGKSKGQSYTPYSATVYDPTWGSGSLLLRVADATPHGLTIYGHEKDNATWALAKKHPACLECIVVHEMARFHERTHGDSAVIDLGDGVLKKIARELANAVRASTTIAWNLKDSVRAAVRAKVRRLLAKYDYPPGQEDKVVELVLERAELFAEGEA